MTKIDELKAVAKFMMDATIKPENEFFSDIRLASAELKRINDEKEPSK